MKMIQKNLDKISFKNELIKIRLIFRLNDFNIDENLLRLYYEKLKDLETNKFLDSINNMIKLQKEIYPHTNIIALIRDYYENNKTYDRNKMHKKEIIEKKVNKYLSGLTKEEKQKLMNDADNEINEDITLTVKINKYCEMKGIDL